MPLNIWLIRHAHRLDFIQPEWFETAALPYDPPLSALGWQQSLELVPQLENSNIQQIFTSPYLRAMQTAYPIAQSLGLKIRVENGLREWLHPEWSWALPETLAIETLAARGLPIDLDYQSMYRPKYPETAKELAARAGQVANEIICQSGNSVLIVAHKFLLAGMVAALTQEASAMTQLELTTAEVMVLSTADRSSGVWKILPLDAIARLSP